MRRVGLVACVSGLVWFTPATGQSPSPPQEGVGLDEIVVITGRQPRTRLNTPQTVTVIRRNEIDERGTQDIRDLVRNEPGVSVNLQTTGTDPFKNNGGFTVRGVSGNRVQILIDGARSIERITDRTRDLFETPFLKSVEIARGPGSVLWGADALGGIVSFRTLDPIDLLGATKPFAARLQSGFDSVNRSWSNTAIAAVRLSPQFAMLAGLNYRRFNEPTFSKARADGGRYPCPNTPAFLGTSNYRFLPCNKVDPQEGFSLNGLLKLVWTPSADHEFKFTGEYFGRNTRVNQLYDFNARTSIAGNVFGGPALAVDNREYLREQQLSRYRIALDHRWNVGLGFLDEIKTKFSYSPQSISIDNLRRQRRATVVPGQIIGTFGELNYKEEFLQADIQLTSRFNTGLIGHTVTWGYQGDQTKTDYQRRDTFVNFATGQTVQQRAGGFNFANAITRRNDVYIQDEMSFFGGRLTVTPGFRFATYQIEPRPDADYRIVPGKPPRVRNSVRPIPQIGTVFKIDENFSVFGRYAEGFKMPTAEQLYTSLPGLFFNLIPNPDLRPEKARTIEAGLRGRFDRGWFSVSAFNTRYVDFIQSFVQVNATDITFQNLSQVRISGIEASGEYRLIDNLILSGAITYQFGVQKANPAAPIQPFDGAGPFRGTLGLRYVLPQYGLEASLVGNFAGGVNRASSPNLVKPGGWSVFDAFLTWRPTPMLTLRGGVMNIANKRYIPSLAGGTTYNKTATAAVAQVNPFELQYAAGRSFRLSAQVEF